MAITTLAGVVSGLQPPYCYQKGTSNINGGMQVTSMYAQGSMPAAATYTGVTTLNGIALSNPVPGQIPWNDPPSGNAYLARLSGSQLGISACGGIALVDRLWHNGGIDITGAGGAAQAITTPSWPARDNNGTTLGDGVLVALEIETNATGTAPPQTSTILTYTNSAGVTGRTSNPVVAPLASDFSPRVIIFGLQAGDAGVRSIQSLTLPGSSWLTGTIHLIAFRFIAYCDMPSIGSGALDAVTGCLPRMYNGSVPFLFRFIRITNDGTATTGQAQFAFG
jgi:hypothetical protein